MKVVMPRETTNFQMYADAVRAGLEEIHAPHCWNSGAYDPHVPHDATIRIEANQIAKHLLKLSEVSICPDCNNPYSYPDLDQPVVTDLHNHIEIALAERVIEDLLMKHRDTGDDDTKECLLKLRHELNQWAGDNNA